VASTLQPPTADTASWLASEPGVSVWSAGGLSGLPALRGLADDRVKVLVDGVDATAACANHMNAPLSYVDPSQVRRVSVLPGVTRVSEGGDNIAGVIRVETLLPVFAEAGQWRSDGELAAQTRSVDHALRTSARAGIANDTVRLDYSGSSTEADSYRDGHGNKVIDTLYKTTTQRLGLAARQGDGVWTASIAEQRVPYQGFANQYMDMTHNHGLSGQLGYRGRFDWGSLQASAYGQNTLHEMGFPSDERTGTMPMNTHGTDAGYRIQAELPMAEGTARIGHEAHRSTLDDWWPPVTGSMMMAPNTYVNIHNGSRSRVALYGEWEGPLLPAVLPRWQGSAGLRYERVRTDAGTVQGYGCGMMCTPDTTAATAFNAADRLRHDDNVDLTLTASHTTQQSEATERSIDIGLAQKTRSPNLYERYSWGRGTMAMMMTGWFGDGNGYVGNLDLKPEVATTLSTAIAWRDAGASDASTEGRWALRVAPYLTYVHNFIDVDPIGTFHPYSRSTETRAQLRFANHDANLYGASVSGHWLAWEDAAWGAWTWRGKLDWTRGQRTDGGELYRMMPLNLGLTLEQRLGRWTSYAQWQVVDSLRHVDERRDAEPTAGYALLNLGTRLQATQGLSLELGVRNVFDRAYDLPLGGVNVAQFKMSSDPNLRPLAGPGRSFDLGVRWRF
jgi:iron complex outermembrane receptor protein